MELDIRLLLTVAGLLVSVVAAAAVAKHQIKTLVEQLQTMKMSISDLQTSMEKNNISTFNLQEKVATLGRILSPEELNMQAEKRRAETAEHSAAFATLQQQVFHLQKDIDYLKHKANKNGYK